MTHPALCQCCGTTYSGMCQCSKAWEQAKTEHTLAKEELKTLTENRYGDPGLELLFLIQEECPEAGIASGLRLGAEILLRHYVALKKDRQEVFDALDQAHSYDRCPYNSYGRCLPCRIIKAERDKQRKQALEKENR